MMEENLKSILNELGNTSLIAVSTTRSIDEIMRVYNMGIRDFGENKVQELVSKINLLPSDINWHMIGHLQSNKVKDIIGKVRLIHSVDTVKLARVIDKEAKKKDIVQDILLEINIANEESKYGFNVLEIDDAINSIKELSNINILGFMCVLPYVEDANDNRKYFKLMRELSYKYGYNILSMGMSNDYMVAIQEGATYVRIGTKIFGERDYSK